jgi:redox-sensitive bicupin YhaK (pirin superfamily)
MLDLRPFASLGAFKNDWLDAHHHFSFADYYDRSRMGLGSLRVWNDDTIKAGTGFDPHPHRDMEIITYIRNGAITHQDGLGNRGRTEAGDVQVMSAGTGIVHAEYNLEPEDMTLFQIWVIPARKRVTPRWENRAFPKTPGRLIPLASGREQDAADSPIEIYQDAAILGGLLAAKTPITHALGTGRAAYLVPTKGSLLVETADGESVEVHPRDGLVVADTERLIITPRQDAEVVLADVAL